MTNLFAGFAPSLPAEVVDVLIQTGRCRLERIVSTGHATSPNEWYDQDTNEWVALLRGSAGLRFEDSDAVVVMRPGDHLVITAHRLHRVEWTDATEPTIWLALHF